MALVVTPSKPVSGVSLYTYDNLDSADTNPEYLTLSGTDPVVGFLQVVGTFGGGTVKLQLSNNGTNWVDAKDISGTAVAITAAGGVEFSTAAVYIRPLISGGSGDDVDVLISFRG